MEKLLAQVEELRDIMVTTALESENIIHQDVLLLSQTLDRLIFEVQVVKRSGAKQIKPQN
jgi:hypothetical protein